MAKECIPREPHGWVNCDSVARGDPFKQVGKIFLNFINNLTHVDIIQLWHDFPALEPFLFEFEKYYNSEIVFDLMARNNYIFPTVSIIIYLLFCYYGQIFMKKRKPFKLDTLLAAWNLFLTLFSVYGMTRMVPQSLWLLSTHNFEYTVCEPAHILVGGGVAGLAIQLFILSKIPELIDTVFIVLRKKQLIFLHWYHHVTVLFFCWDSYVTESSGGHWFASMNLTVHAIMYFYFFMQAIKKVPKWFPSWIITFIQIAQMIAGTFIVVSCIYYHLYGGEKYPPGKCNKLSNLILGAVIYSSYLYLFVHFAVKKFVFGESIETIKKNM